MKNLSKAVLTASVIAASTASADTSLTAGFVSDYVFRGVDTSSGSAYFSVDHEEAGFNVGIWAIDDTDDTDGPDSGLEVDIYAGYGIEINDDVSIGIGYTRYEYTGNREGDPTSMNIDDAGVGSQDEIGVNITVSEFSFDYYTGTNNDVLGGEDQDYDVYSLTYSGEVLSVLVGMVETDDIDSMTVGESEYNWAEIAASKEIAGINFGATVGVQFGAEKGGDDTSSNDGYIVLDVSKSFDI